MLRPLFLAALLVAATAHAAPVVLERDGEGRIVRMDLSPYGPNGPDHYTVEALPGADLRAAPGRLVLEFRFGRYGVIGHVEGLPLATAAPLERDPETGAPIEAAEGQLQPDAETFARVDPFPPRSIYGLVRCGTTALDPEQRARDQAFCTSGHLWDWQNGRLLLDTDLAPFRPIPDEWSALDQALLGCGAAYGTSCADGIDLFLADPTVIAQYMPFVDDELPSAWDSEVLRLVAWNWLAAHVLRAEVMPGVGDAADCTLETIAGCDGLPTSDVPFAVRRALADEPTPGRLLRWDWELGTKFEMGAFVPEPGADPRFVDLVRARGLPRRIHIVGPFEPSPGAEPEAEALWVPEAAAIDAGTAALICLFALRRRRRRDYSAPTLDSRVNARTPV